MLKRRLLLALGMTVLLSACVDQRQLAYEKYIAEELAAMSPEDRKLCERFRGIHGGVLALGATSQKKRITLTDDRGRLIASPGGFGPGGTGFNTYRGGAFPLPKAVRAVWREGAGWDSVKKVWNDGTIVGDYTVSVAERIPDSILDYIRQNGGALRLKITLADHGILIGWDVEKSLPIPGCQPGTVASCTALHYFHPGGDFRERVIAGGKVIEKGWYRDAGRNKVETNW